MARIRSIHPEQWTGESFVECSPFARLLALGLRNFSDDAGIFEWKPNRLKMQILPSDDVVIEELLNELKVNGIVTQFEVENKIYGAIKSFCQFQSPLRPKYTYERTSEIDTFVKFNAIEERKEKKANQKKNDSTKTQAPPRDTSKEGYAFNRFAAAYPHIKIDTKTRESAYQFWCDHNLTGQEEEIITRLKAWKDCGKWKEQDGFFIPKINNFLERHMWQQQPPKGERNEVAF